MTSWTSDISSIDITMEITAPGEWTLRRARARSRPAAPAEAQRRSLRGLPAHERVFLAAIFALIVLMAASFLVGLL